MTLEELTRVCSYPWYGAGGHQSIGRLPLSINGVDLVNADGKWVSTIRATKRFNLRLFVDSWSIVPEKESTNQSFTIRLNPTEQNFYNDDFLRLLHANGRNAIFCPSGLFDWLKVDGYSQRKSACYDHSKSPSDPAAWKDYAHLFKLLAEYFKDKPYEIILQGGNELDFPWNVVKELAPEEIAVGQWEIIKAIQSVNPNQKIMLGCTLNPTMDTFNRYVGTIEQLAAAEGKTVPYSQVIWSDNHYVRDQGGNQGGGLADTPESQWEQTYVYRTQLNAACKQRGMKFEITEHGYSNSTSTSFAALKQKAPSLQGVTHDEAPGVLWFRSMLMYASFSECTGVSVYHCKDGFEAEPFTYIGINYDKDFGGKEDWSSKPGKIYYESQLDLYGKLDVVKYHRANNIYYATLSSGQILHWTDKVNIGTVTPMPALTATIPQPPPMPTLTVVNKQLQWSDGVPCNLIHADSPESRLHPNYKAQFSAESKLLPTYGINTITVTMRGDDVTAISPFINNNPSQGIDVAKLQTWHGQLKEFLTECENSGLRGVIIAYLGERTNFKSITDQQYENWFIEMGKIFQDISGSIIFGWEEIWDGSDSATMRFADRIGSLLKSYLPNSLLMVHNNPGQKPFNAGSSFVKLICIQETSVSAMKATAEAALSKGFAVHFHELYPGFKLSNSQDTNKNLMAELVTAAKSVGVNNVGCFASDYDLQAPDAGKLSYLYQYQSQLINGATPPPTMATIKYSTSVTHPADAPELKDNLNLAPGNYAVFTDVAGTFDLYKNGVRFSNYFPHPENGAPFDMYGTSGSNANLFPFTQGTWKLEFTDKSNNKTSVNFTVGEIVPPPTGDSPVTTITHKADGKLVFKSEDGRERVI